MTQPTRTTGPVDPDDFGTPRETKPAETAMAREARQAAALNRYGIAAHVLAGGVTELDATLADVTQAFTDGLDYPALAEMVAWLQSLRAKLGEAEAYVAREMGRLDGCPEVITLPDGRHAQVMKGRERKEWRHDDWKRDVRLKITDTFSDLLPEYLVVPETGEQVSMKPMFLEAIAQAQAVHGSTAPKVTSLKALGLAADDYCTSGPGPYRVSISAPATTQED